ncbi:unnamed protein product [Paramecium sonneborni]|uniref:PP2A regulatory subunit B'' EF-hand domain-containing protein n=1 Tax=Paramecium sonneborni TaxID=65129 RepID=A0A8S1K9B6_9CILI|nr:unnamed protein product [Paramecium sonneborni]
MIISGLSQSALLNSPNIKSQKPSIPTKIDSIYNLKLKIPEDLSQSLTQSQIFFKKCHKSICIQNLNKMYIPCIYSKKSSMKFWQIRLIDAIHFQSITTILCGLCKYLTKLLMIAIEGNVNKITKSGFLKYWNLNLAQKEPKKRCFQIPKKPKNDFIQFDDFKPFMKILLEQHPGLEFLSATPEFQERYAETFHHLCRKDNDKITWRDFKQSNLFDILDTPGKEDYINKVPIFIFPLIYEIIFLI